MEVKDYIRLEKTVVGVGITVVTVDAGSVIVVSEPEIEVVIVDAGNVVVTSGAVSVTEMVSGTWWFVSKIVF